MRQRSKGHFDEVDRRWRELRKEMLKTAAMPAFAFGFWADDDAEIHVTCVCHSAFTKADVRHYLEEILATMED